MGWSGQSNISSSPAGEIEVGHHNQLQGYFRTFYDKIYLHPFYTNKIQIHNGNCGSIPHHSVQYFCACSTHVWYGVAGVFHVRELLSQAVQCLDNSNGNCEVTVAPDLYQDPLLSTSSHILLSSVSAISAKCNFLFISSVPTVSTSVTALYLYK